MNKTVELPTVDECVALFDKVGIKPIRGDYTIIEDGKVSCGCLATALYLSENDYTNEKFCPIWNWAQMKYGYSNAVDLIEGFDKVGQPLKTENPWYMLGWNVAQKLGI